MAEAPIKLFATRSERYPKSSDSDIAYGIVKTLLSVYGPISEILSLVITPPLLRRRDEWFKDLSDAVDEIASKCTDFTPEKLANNDQFISAVIEASRIAVSTHKIEKREMLKNALVNIGTSCNIDEDVQFMSFRLIEDLTVTHIKILEFFWRGNRRVAAANGGNLPRFILPAEVFRLYLPELHEKARLVNQMIADLRTRGLCTAQEITSGFSQQVMTNPGIEFLSFVLAPE